MTETEKKALALVNEVEGGNWLPHETDRIRNFATICRAIEQHEAFKRAVSDAVEGFYRDNPYEISCYCDDLKRFIIPKTDPLVEAVNEAWGWRGPHPDVTENLRAAIEARGGRIVWEGE